MRSSAGFRSTLIPFLVFWIAFGTMVLYPKLLEAQADVNGDGRPELLVFSEGAWKGLDTVTGQFFTISSAFNEQIIPLPGKWKEGINVLWLEVNKSDLNFYTSAGEQLTIPISKNKHTVLPPRDINGNGFADLVILEQKGKKLLWHVYNDPFLNQGKLKSKAKRFAKSGDLPFLFRSRGKKSSPAVVKNFKSRTSRILFCKGKCKKIRKKRIKLKDKPEGEVEVKAIANQKGADSLVVIVDQDGQRQINFTNKRFRVDSTREVSEDAMIATGQFSGTQEDSMLVLKNSPTDGMVEIEVVTDDGKTSEKQKIPAPEDSFSLLSPQIEIGAEETSGREVQLVDGTTSSEKNNQSTANKGKKPTGDEEKTPPGQNKPPKETATPVSTVPATPTTPPQPTATALPQPTATSTVRPTPIATAQATATATPRFTATATVLPTATTFARPTATATSQPTATTPPQPTATPFKYLGDISLIDTDTDLPVVGYAALQNVSTIDKGLISTSNLSVSANVIRGVGSIVFDYNNGDYVKTETHAPYALFGDSGGSYSPGPIPLGQTSLRIRAYDAAGGTGNILEDIELSFNVIDSSPTPTMTPTATATPTAGVGAIKEYGTRMASSSLANTNVGRSDVRVSLRFKAEKSGKLRAFRTYWIYKDTSGYHDGDGGVIRISLREDDGTSAHNPKSTSLATATLTPNIPTSGSVGRSVRFVKIGFSNPPTVEAGKIYHLHFHNIDPNQDRNWISINAMFHRAGSSSSLPTVPRSDWALLKRSGPSGSWSVRSGYIPILALYMDETNSGSETGVFGKGYMESWNAIRHHKFTITGSKKMRQILKPTTDVTVTTLNIHAGRYSGSGPLTARLRSSSGAILREAQFDSSEIPSAITCSWGYEHQCHVWASQTYYSPYTLKAGNTYYLELSSGSTQYKVNLIREGASYGFPSVTYFSGYAQQSTDNGATWKGPTVWGNTDRKEGDFEFYFDTQ